MYSVKRKFKKCNGGCDRWTPIWSHGQCRACWFKNNPPKKKPYKKRIKQLSEKGIQKNLAYKKARLEFLETHDVCEVNLPDCLVPYPTTDVGLLQVHHKKGRLGSLLVDKDYFLCVCHNCHRYIEDFPSWAIENGYSISRLKK